tara:strand:+ start:17349 stop:17543 length:195 start_codon:yes stop_codon:yes gene_type:complete
MGRIMRTTKSGKIEPHNISFYWVEDQYFVGCFAMLTFPVKVVYNARFLHLICYYKKVGISWWTY